MYGHPPTTTGTTRKQRVGVGNLMQGSNTQRAVIRQICFKDCGKKCRGKTVGLSRLLELFECPEVDRVEIDRGKSPQFQCIDQLCAMLISMVDGLCQQS